MSTQQVALSRGRTNLALATLFFGVFVLGCAELLVVGVLNLIAADLQVSIAAAGTLVTAYALGIAIGGPILTALTIKLSKRAVLIGTLILFALANLVPVLVPDYGLFVVARILAGAIQGLFIAVGFVTGMSFVPPERAGRAISVIISGIAVSAALGVPLGTLVGQTLGWRGSFTGIIMLSVVALIAMVALVPAVPRTGSGVAGQARYAFAPRVLAVLALNFLVFAAVYSALTYIVPFLEGVTGTSGALISVFLLAYGLANAVGAFGGGRFADKNAARTLIVATCGTAVCLLALYLVGAIALLVAPALLAWGLFVGGMVPSLQFRVVSLAGPGGALASSLPGSAVNVGIAFGSVAGGVAIDNFSASAPLIAGLIIAVIAIPAAWATSFLKPPMVQGAAALTPDVA
ncbi:MFS transporter [Nonomuraea sp. NPDC059194]|uniref:MFS transporter n=1 Tax=Nonomuraea sp. NPDC059194 TaxID=3346764 RepID=UPI0036D01F0C